MAFVRLPYAFILSNLSLLVLCTFTLANHSPPAEAPLPHHPPPPYHHTSTPPPAHSPVKPPPPAHPPVKPPTPHPHVKPPSPGHLPRKLVAIQGVVYCKPCKSGRIHTLKGASPLAGAVVRLQCNNTKHGSVDRTQTDKNGYFVFRPKEITTAAVPKCKVFLVSSPREAKCRVPTNLNHGFSGAVPIASRTPPAKPTPYQFFDVGPFSFESSDKKSPCHY